MANETRNHMLLRMAWFLTMTWQTSQVARRFQELYFLSSNFQELSGPQISKNFLVLKLPRIFLSSNFHEFSVLKISKKIVRKLF